VPVTDTLGPSQIPSDAGQYFQMPTDITDIRKDLRILANELESLKPFSTISSSVERHVKRYQKHSSGFKVLGGAGSVDATEFPTARHTLLKCN
jgi:hypothetical protein